MKNSKLKSFQAFGGEVLSRNEMKNVLGGGPFSLPVCKECCPTEPCRRDTRIVCPAVVCPK